MIVLLPPSEGKSADAGTGVFGEVEPELLKDTKSVLKHLRGLKGADVGKFLGVKQTDKAAEWLKRDLAIAKAGCLPAVDRYSGVVYDHIDFSTIKSKKRAASRVVIVSGMFGAISGNAQIPEYKLPMNPWLTKYWKPINTERIAAIAKKKKVLSLLSQSYAKALEFDGLIHVDFKVQGGKKSAGHFGKAIKGRFVRFLLENNVKTVDDFDGFTEEGYQFDGTDFIQR